MTTPTMDLGKVGIWTATFDGVSFARRAGGRGPARGARLPDVVDPRGRRTRPVRRRGPALGAHHALNVATGIANIYAPRSDDHGRRQRTLAEAYPGRFLLGLGVSHHHLVDRVRKHDYEKPSRYMNEYLDAMDAACSRRWAPERSGRVLAALGPKMLELAAGRRPTGPHPYFTTPEHTARARGDRRPRRAARPRADGGARNRPDRARTLARPGWPSYLRAPNYLNNLPRLGFTTTTWPTAARDRLVDAIVAWGDVDVAVARVREHHEAGATHVCVQVFEDPLTAVPEGGWADLAAGLGEL